MRIVSEMGFLTVTEIGQVLLLRNIGFSDDNAIRTKRLEQQTQNLNKAISLRPVDAGGVGFLPDEADRIKTNLTHTVARHPTQQIGESNQHIGTSPVQIHLVRTEGGPHLTFGIRRAQLSEQGRAARPDNIAPAGIRSSFKNAGLAGILTSKKLPNPGMGSGDMVQNKICHQPTSLRQSGEIVPIAMALFQLFVAGHSKTAITGGFEKRQHVDDCSEIRQVAVHEAAKTLQTGTARIHHGVGIGDQHSIPPAPKRWTSLWGVPVP